MQIGRGGGAAAGGERRRGKAAHQGENGPSIGSATAQSIAKVAHDCRQKILVVKRISTLVHHRP